MSEIVSYPKPGGFVRVLLPEYFREGAMAYVRRVDQKNGVLIVLLDVKDVIDPGSFQLNDRGLVPYALLDGEWELHSDKKIIYT